MSRQIILALDAMGGDNAPSIVIKGANIARERHENIHFLLFGDQEKIKEHLQQLPKLAERCTIHHTDEAIPAEMKPSMALRNLKKSSMRLAIDAVKNGHAQGAVSAGNTGALMALAKLILGTMDGVSRPAIASFFPTEKGESVMLDLGANVDCDAENLVQFAIMGEVFARTALGILKPSVGLLNVGSEEQKGRDYIREAAQQIRQMALPIDFKGFVEGNDITGGTVDVIVTDGFTGNVALKTAEGTSKLYTNYLRRVMKTSLASRIGYLLSKRAFTRLKEKLDPRQYNGAVFLGLNGIAVKSHGGTDALGFANAVDLAVDMAKHGFCEVVNREFSRVNAMHIDPAPVLETV